MTHLISSSLPCRPWPPRHTLAPACLECVCSMCECGSSKAGCGAPVLAAVLFDLDNTLITTREADAAACLKVATWLEGQGWSSESSWQVTRRYLHAFREEPAPPHPTDQEGLDKWRRDLWETVLPPEYEHLELVFSIWKTERLSHLQLKPSVKQMLKELGEHFSLGLITNGPSVAQWEKIRETGCRAYFGALVVSEDHDVEKPDKALFDIVCEELQVKPCECLMVGDKLETDVQGGVNAGMVTVWLNGRGRTAPKDLQPDHTIDRILDLTTVLRRDMSLDLENCTSS